MGVSRAPKNTEMGPTQTIHCSGTQHIGLLNIYYEQMAEPERSGKASPEGGGTQCGEVRQRRGVRFKLGSEEGGDGGGTSGDTLEPSSVLPGRSGAAGGPWEGEGPQQGPWLGRQLTGATEGHS